MEKIKNNFEWGVATAAYQVEGAAQLDGRAPSIWDVFAHTPGKIFNGDTGDIACDQYHRYIEDVSLMQELGVTAYRFSFSWSRLLPQGDLSVINPLGVKYYHNLIDELLSHGIKPFVTLYHWDLPQALQERQQGWLNQKTALDFANYAEFCFREYGAQVRNWITLNEPWCSAVLGYGQGVFAPGIIDAALPYQVAHNLLLAHGWAVEKFRNGNFNGQIGISNNCDWREPLTNSSTDIEAAQKSLEFFYGWFTDPVVYGDYPEAMKLKLGRRMPQFSASEQRLLRNSSDFLGLNHYTTHYVSSEPVTTENVIGNGVGEADTPGFLSNDPDWLKSDMNWNIVPWGGGKMLQWIAERYPGLPIYVTENGCAVKEDSVEDALHDDLRCNYLTEYIASMWETAQKNNLNFAGYFCWSLLDNFEWGFGYSKRFGIIRCDYETLERIPKKSFYCYQKIIQQYTAKIRNA